LGWRTLGHTWEPIELTRTINRLGSFAAADTKVANKRRNSVVFLFILPWGAEARKSHSNNTHALKQFIAAKEILLQLFALSLATRDTDIIYLFSRSSPHHHP
jgi:hypothetical protein